jgi:hypothetical protein
VVFESREELSGRSLDQDLTDSALFAPSGRDVQQPETFGCLAVHSWKALAENLIAGADRENGRTLFDCRM